ncbi:hypothetical protein [Falsiroseomonas sp.]|uniref:hypothetical protein n=1 Tax=Falsiroseomonas sp. TaxID=2870721 RepID=UPI0034A1B10A
MSWSLDARIPILIVADPAALTAALAGGRPAAVLLGPAPEGASRSDAPPPGAVALARFDLSGPAHAAACACCAGRSPAAVALDTLFQARIRNTCPWFERVVALAEAPVAQAEIAAALASDAVTAARFRAG